MFQKIILSLLALILTSCDGYKFDIPQYDYILSTSIAENLPYNVNFTQKTFPKKLKKLIQKKDNEILNILEFNKSGQLIFKYYRQYVGENWNGRYLTIIESNKFDNENNLIDQIILHSNLGITRYLYSYDHYRNLKEINSSIIEPKGTNSNPWKYVENIHSNLEFLKDKNVNNILKKELDDYLFRKYDYKNRTVIESNKENMKVKSYLLYKMNDQNKLISEEYFDDDILSLNNSKYFQYHKYSYTEIKKRRSFVASTKEYVNVGDTLKINLKDIENKYIDKRIYLGKILILQNATTEGNRESFETYKLDEYKVPSSAIIKEYGEKEKFLKFENYYEFFN